MAVDGRIVELDEELAESMRAAAEAKAAVEISRGLRQRSESPQGAPGMRRQGSGNFLSDLVATVR